MITPFLVPIDELINNSDRTTLKSSSDSGDGTLTVYSINKFAVNQCLVIGELGSESTEYIKTHAATAPSGTTVTLASNLSKDHPKDTPVYIVPYDQVEFYYAATATGTKTLQDTQTIDVERNENKYDETTYSTGFLFSRFSNSITSAATDYSDAYPITGAEDNTVGNIINSSMTELRKEFNEVLTYGMLIDTINECLRDIRGQLKFWSNVVEPDYIVDQMNRGEYKWALPLTYYDPNSNRSCLSVRVGTGTPLKYMDKREMDAKLYDVSHTTVDTQAEIGDTSIVLSSTNDLSDSGTIHIYSGTNRYSITYTDNDKDTDTLSGVPASGTGSITAQLTSGLNVWQGESEGDPTHFTILDGYLYILDLINSTDAGQNIYMDFYTEIVKVDSDSDEITLARFDMVKHWVRWMIKNITENNGKLDMEDADWIMYNRMLLQAIRRETTGQKRKWKRKINNIDYGMEGYQGDPTIYERS